MSRKHNQDYYKVSGSEIESRDQTAQSRVKFATDTARLRREARTEGPRVSARTVKAAAKKTPGPRAAKVETAPPPRAPEPPPRREEPVAIVREIHPSKVKHGKKRRSSQKRHEVAVLHELEAARRPEAPAARVTASTALEQPEVHGPTTAPPSAQELMARIRRAGALGREALALLSDLVQSPLVLARLLWSLRQQHGR